MAEQPNNVKVTRCPTAYCAPSSGTVSETDRANVSQYHAERELQYKSFFPIGWKARRVR